MVGQAVSPAVFDRKDLFSTLPGINVIGDNKRFPPHFIFAAAEIEENPILSLEDGLFEQRVARIHEIEALGYSPFGKRFDFTHSVPEILRDYSAKTAEELTRRKSVCA